jgi:all-trans-retinol dehydrogenase (NAD+)
VNEAAAAVKSFLGPPGILINNAGLAKTHSILDASPEHLRLLFDVNTLSQYYTLQAFLPDMIRRRKGHVVTIASMASYATVPGLVDYGATKAAVLTLHEGLHAELKHRYDAPEIKTSIVHPTYVRTRLVDSYLASLEKKNTDLLTPETVANAVINQITSGKSGQIYLPPVLSLISAIRAFPWWFQEVIRDSLKNDCRDESELSSAPKA